MKKVIYCTDIVEELEEIIRSRGYSRIVFLTDSNTVLYSLPVFNSMVYEFNVLEVPAGENSKSLHYAGELWNQLLQLPADRSTLLVNLGGGMLTDLGGFIAATYKRGIDFINIPTSLLAMVDAAIGKKTGINLGHYKNQVGVFARPVTVLINDGFLNTLPERELASGMSEVIKYSLIGDDKLWEELLAYEDWNALAWEDIIKRGIRQKLKITRKDPKEKGIRKVLNFGHTIGHAIEANSQESEFPLLHGEAIAQGMLAEAYLSHLKAELPAEELEQIKTYINKYFTQPGISEKDYPALLQYMLTDKKNHDGQIGFSLLKKIGEAVYDIYCNEEEIFAALDYLRQEWKH